MRSIAYELKKLYHFIRERGWRSTLDYYFWYQCFYIYPYTQRLFLRTFFPRLIPYPRMIEVETSTRCGFKCRMCEHTYWSEPSRLMSLREFETILDNFPKLKWIGLTGIGDSFANPDFLPILRLVKSRGIYVEIFDNFYNIEPDVAAELLELGVDHIFVSLDAATPETYRKIRPGSNFQRVINNVSALYRIKREKGIFLPEMRFHYITSKLNQHELLRFLEMVDKIRGGLPAKVLFAEVLHPFKEIEDLYYRIPRSLMDKAERRGNELGLAVHWNRDVFRGQPISTCTNWSQPYIFVDGSVLPCCALNEGNHRAFQREHALGNVFQQPFKDIWYGEKYTKLRLSVHRGRALPPCDKCPIYDEDER